MSMTCSLGQGLFSCPKVLYSLHIPNGKWDFSLFSRFTIANIFLENLDPCLYSSALFVKLIRNHTRLIAMHAVRDHMMIMNEWKAYLAIRFYYIFLLLYYVGRYLPTCTKKVTLTKISTCLLYQFDLSICILESYLSCWVFKRPWRYSEWHSTLPLMEIRRLLRLLIGPAENIYMESNL